MPHYLIALGSNMRHGRHGAPAAVLDAAIARIGLKVRARSRTRMTAPVGPSRRAYANAAILAETGKNPKALLRHLKALEQRFGRRTGGGRWQARPLDLDIVLWSGGIWVTPGLAVPHPLFRTRRFVLEPAAEIAPRWRDPVSGLQLRHLLARLDRKRPHP